jgi:hypothetical protein
MAKLFYLRVQFGEGLFEIKEVGIHFCIFRHRSDPVYRSAAKGENGAVWL